MPVLPHWWSSHGTHNEVSKPKRILPKGQQSYIAAEQPTELRPKRRFSRSTSILSFIFTFKKSINNCDAHGRPEPFCKKQKSQRPLARCESTSLERLVITSSFLKQTKERWKSKMLKNVYQKLIVVYTHTRTGCLFYFDIKQTSDGCLTADTTTVQAVISTQRSDYIFGVSVIIRWRSCW